MRGAPFRATAALITAVTQMLIADRQAARVRLEGGTYAAGFSCGCRISRFSAGVDGRYGGVVNAVVATEGESKGAFSAS